MKLAALVCYSVALVFELYGVRALLGAAKVARELLAGAKPSMILNPDGTATLTIDDDSKLFAGEVAALSAQALPSLAVSALFAGIGIGFAGNILSQGWPAW
jgi:hypothetical protein